METLAMFFGCAVIVAIAVTGVLLLAKVCGFNDLPGDELEYDEECEFERRSEVK